MDDNLYDEFGNYIGPDLDDDDDDSGDDDMGVAGDDWEDAADVGSAGAAAAGGRSADMETEEVTDAREEEKRYDDDDDDDDQDMSRAVILPDDKTYYDDASKVYPDAEVLVQEEDTQPIETPIIAPIKTKIFENTEKALPATTFDYRYLAGLMDHPTLVRSFALIGHLHHGKTTFMDMLVKQTHLKEWNPHKEVRYTDSRIDEQRRELSIKALPMSLVLPSLSGKSFLLNVMDTPGHVNFSDEQTAALRLCDGAVVVVDAVEGVMLQTQRSLIHAAQERLPILLVINKVDRLFLELKLPPGDAYHKLCNTLEDVNSVLVKIGYPHVLSPDRGNVCFASALHHWCFSLESFAQIYTEYHQTSFSARDFAKRLWGDRYMHPSTRQIRRKPESSGDQRTFVQFILEPLYKIYSFTLGSQGRELAAMLGEIGVTLSQSERNLDPKPLLKVILGRFFGDTGGFVQMVADNLPSPLQGNAEKVPHIYSGDLNTAAGKAMIDCDANGTLMMHVTKLYPRPDCSAFDAFGRVFSGTVRVGDRVRVLGEGYSLDDDEDMMVREITKMWVYQGRYRVEVNRVTAGNWGLFEGIDASITKTATICSYQGNDEACIFRPLKFNTKSAMKVAIEPINPSELPKMLDGLRKINKTYPLVTTKVEESGEHIILGTGELYLDCVLHDLREMYSEIEIKVADPVVTFCETVADTSSLKCFAETPNKRNKITMIASPLDAAVSRDIEQELIRLDQPIEQVAAFFESKHSWDVLASRSVWAFGPDAAGPNILLDDTLSSETNKSALFSVKHSIVQGFQWATREGPLCYEPMRNVQFKVLEADISDEPILRGGGQIIPTARRVAYSAFLLGTPKLLEPIYLVEIQAPPDCVNALYNVLNRRRGHILSNTPKPGTPLYTIHAYIPLIESFGFETDLRTHTQGQAFCLSVFDHWNEVPGDPLDKDVILRPLEPANIDELAREFMVKTRRRKGLSEDVSINKFFEESMLLELARQDADLAGYFAE